MIDNGSANVIRNMRAWGAMKMAGIDGLGRLTAAEAATKAKAEAPWQPNYKPPRPMKYTGNARQGLYGRWRAMDKVIELGHRVTYGVHLELGFNGRFSILEPTINAIKNAWFVNVKRIMEH